MYFLLAAILVTLIAGITYLYYSSKNKNEENILDDIPSIDVKNEDLEKHALEISKEYSETKITNSRRKIIKSLDRSYKKILEGYEFIDRDVRNKREVVSAGEWLLDNLYLIEKEYKHIKQSMPEDYYNNLPVIDKGIMKGYPRIYHIAVEMVSHTDGKIEENTILRFIEAYQNNTILSSGELWALPIMLRIALIQNISKITEKIILAQKEKRKADIIADNLINSIEEGNLKDEIDKLSSKELIFSTHFCERLLKVLRDNGIDNQEVYTWIDEKLELQETNSEKMINLEHQKQANYQLSMGNCVHSVRQVEGLNWRDGFEELSYVEKILRTDPSDIYSKMDFESRDYYRHNVERMSKKINKPESFVAKKAIDCAEECDVNEAYSYKKHVGYYLVDDGVGKLKEKIGKNSNKIKADEDFNKKNKVQLYVGIIIVGTLIIMSFFLYISYINDINRALWRYIVAALALLIPCSEIVTSILNWSINHLSVPDFIPKMELKDGIEEKDKTIVVIPTIVNTPERVEELISDMEVYYLANSEKNLYFALLADFKDSNKKEEKNDSKLIKTALEAVKNLNKKYSNSGNEIFYFLSRYRKYNESEEKWLAWERKRGKLIEFNRLIRGAKDTSYDIVSGNIHNLINAKYVITLDSDTQLPRDTAKKMIGAMSHILNVPHIDKGQKRVTRGYGLMQPKISISTVSANKTMFSTIFSGETGIDTYTTAVSDAYQDLFKEGIFTGKGIYEVDTFNYMLEREIPENSVLSHDLLEGSYVRAALVTDLELIDGYPATYNSSAKRLHRWVRGDWQLIPWLKNKQSLNRLSIWKIFDNLRRSLLAPSIMLLFALSFNVLPDGTDKWIIAAVVALVIPLLFDVTEVIVSPMRGMNLTGKLENWKSVIEQIFLIFCFLPHKAYLMIDAIVRTIYRTKVSKKHLLEWQTAADADIESKDDIGFYVKLMWPGSLIALIIGMLAFMQSINSGLFMLPSSIIWFVSPYVAYYISKDIEKTHYVLNENQKELLKILARETWAYFEDFVDDDNNWLAPDNYQQDPSNGVAHRTSPTNMGMGIISNVVAHDLGYVGIIECVDRIDKCIISMETLKRYKGHFYNWYNTKSKEILRPEYISTVDSGNLVGYLWVTSTALDEYLSRPIIDKNFASGLKDTILLANKELEDKLGIKNYYQSVLVDVDNLDADILNYKRILLDLWDKCIKVSNDNKKKDELYWNEKVKNTLTVFLVEMQKLFPWADLLIERSNKLKEVSEKLKDVSSSVSLIELNAELDKITKDINRVNFKNKDDKYLAKELLSSLKSSKIEINKLVIKIENLKSRINNMATATDFRILYDEKRQLFSIGYDIEKDSIGKSYYDLLASEARQASFIAIAKGDVDQKHWFKLGRAMAVMGRSKGLVSWSGTMFEYLMPLLIMKTYPKTLLHETYRSIVDGQKRYCKNRRVPWGISESAFRSFDVGLNYQYKAFGIPGIGLKRGLVNELVISPYSTVMALQVDQQAAMSNIQRLISEGLSGRYGLYEAIDYTKDRMPKGKKKAVVKCFMVHHLGMSLLSLDNVLNQNILQKRFHSVPEVKATELLLQEKVPKRIVYEREQKFEASDAIAEKQNVIVRRFSTGVTDIPETQLLSNGSYSLMMTNSGSGYSKLNDMTVYRWHEDVTMDNTGMYFYIKDVNSNEFFSATYEPTKKIGEKYDVIFSLDKAEFRRVDRELNTKTEIAVSNEDNVEVRKITITNHGNEDKIIEITSYCEVTLAPFNSDIVHPAFSNLFIRTEYDAENSCIIANRRPREHKSKKPWAMQSVVVDGNSIGQIQYETSRANFIGRGRNLYSPTAMEGDTPLTNTVGAVLDPIISIRRRIKIAAGESCKVSYSTGVAESRDGIKDLARKYREVTNIDRVFELAWTQSQVEMNYLGIKYPQANLYQAMASRILFMNKSLQKRSDLIKNVKRSQPSLWQYGISGDVPIVTVVIKEEKDKDLVRQMLNAHEFWSIKGLKVDLVFLNLQNTAYFQPLQDSLRDLIGTSHARDKLNKSGGVFLRSKSTMDKEDIDLIMAISRLVIENDKGFVFTQIKNDEKEKLRRAKLEPVKATCHTSGYKFEVNKLKYFNQFGGFDLQNNQYVIRLKNGINTPAPWINVVANGQFGFHVSETGSAYTWCRNSRENKLTAWSNDWIKDIPSEAAFIRDEEMGVYWSITPKPVRDNGEYIVEHGYGYSNFKHEAYGIIGEMKMFVPRDDKVKICLVKLKNNTSEKRKLSLSYYAQVVMGVVPQHTNIHVATTLNKEKKYIYAQNPYSANFGNLLAYLTIKGGENESFTGDRTEFIGRNESLESPEFMKYTRLSDNSGGGLDPCMVENTKFSLNPNEEKTLIVMLGAEEKVEDIEKAIGKYSSINNINAEIENVKQNWDELLKTIQVKTPDTTMDIMLNGWFLYQTIACRLWSRTAFYQSGGAFGFRDQLQDVMSLSYIKPEVTRAQIIYAASRQYTDGDVQHWWHPVVESGIRTRFSDDLLWLPYVTIDYIKNTGDYSVLDEMAGYMEDEPLKEDEDERYTISRVSNQTGSIYEHCVKAIERALKFGEHNIPLMGCGDWNDGMNTIGNKGKGESVWVGWFLYTILDDFKDISKEKNDDVRSQRYAEMQEFIKENLEKYAWDGSWYRRAYFDDGTPLGSIENEECQIDSLSQSWSVISNAAKEERAKEAMHALEKYLVKYDKGMVLLLTPAFDKTKLEPGYIKGYVPGVRENGGQYTHAATWVVMALTKLRDGDKAWKIYNMINPINHTRSYYECERYKVEPYVMAADVYEREPHTGRGGWTWYTGAAGWMYRVGIDGILGLKLQGDKGFIVDPVVPEDWEGFQITYKHKGATYIIDAKKGQQSKISIDGKELEDSLIPYGESGEHHVEVVYKNVKARIEEMCK
ncbi:glucoamylase family protein [Clostridium sediminicola]|uniref:GH36-type glycosyl hydrolase domain-containing protein n=1 Tax=Clostridium sediminicola TaxID=3114879 RepID=UPI0031F1E547